MNTARVFVTGATGFVGKALVEKLSESGVNLSAAHLAEEDVGDIPGIVRQFIVPPLSGESDYSEPLGKADIVIHLAARAHILRETKSNSLQKYLDVNFHGTENLARQAAEKGIKRFVFISTIGVNGSLSGNRPFSETDEPNPHNQYSVSKYRAEVALREISRATGMDVVIIRPPLVYGPGAKGNLLRLMRHIYRGLPLPTGQIPNKRSLISLDNMVDVIMKAAFTPECSNNIYTVCDGGTISTADLVLEIAKSMGRQIRMVKLPGMLFSIAPKIFPGIKPSVDGYVGNLVIDNAKFKKDTSWLPVQSFQDGIASMASRFLECKQDYR